jgi:hypothetical protein
MWQSNTGATTAKQQMQKLSSLTWCEYHVSRGNNLEEQLHEFCADGWQLVTVVPDQRNGNFVVIFKRDRWSLHWGMIILAVLAAYGLFSILHDQSFW